MGDIDPDETPDTVTKEDLASSGGNHPDDQNEESTRTGYCECI